MYLRETGHLGLLQSAASQQLCRFADNLDLGSFDLLLIGDGSGNTYQESAGWGCIAYDAVLGKVVVHAGGFSGGTNNLAELLPLLQALWYHAQEHKGKSMKGCRVAIISDSEITVRCGNGRYTRNANGCWWAALEWFEQQGYEFQCRHVRRLSCIGNEFADAVAAEARTVMDNLGPVICDLEATYFP